MPPKRPGPKSKTVPNPAGGEDSTSSDSSGFLPSPRSSHPQQGNQPPQDPVAGPSNSVSRPRSGILKNSNLSHRSEPDSGFVNRDDVTDSIRSPLVNEEGARGNKTGSAGGNEGSSSSSHSHFLDDNRNDHSGTRHSFVIISLELLLS